MTNTIASISLIMSNANERNRNSVVAASRHPHRHKRPSPPLTPTASDALPLPLYLTNTIFFTLFFSVVHRWHDKISSSTPLHVVTLSEITAIVSLIASFIYLLGFFGIDFVHSFSLSTPLKNPNNPETLETPAEQEPPKKLPHQESAIVELKDLVSLLSLALNLSWEWEWYSFLMR